MKHLLFVLTMLLGMCNEMPTPDDSIIGIWKVKEDDKSENNGIVILDFREDGNITIDIDRDGNGGGDFKRNWKYVIKKHEGLDAIYLIISDSNNEYVWSYFEVKTNELELTMIRDSYKKITYNRIK